ncbi:MAG: hypothetical protein AAFP82_02185 [Bacteroidota bacterium]
MKKLWIYVILLFFSFQIYAQKKKVKLPNELYEASGLYAASPDSLYWLNDSGNSAEIYLTNANGELLNTIGLPLRNRDWEDLTHDDKGNLYIGDFGNNANKRRDLKIYIYNLRTQILDSITYVYPDQTQFPPAVEYRNFDMEGFFWHQNRLHLFSKNKLRKGNYYTKHYTLPAMPGQQDLQLRDSILLKKRVVTAAAISPDGQAVALLAYDFGFALGFIPNSKVSIFLLQTYGGDNYFSGTLSEQKLCFFSPIHQYEALDFIDNQHALIASEKAKFYKQKSKRIKLRKRKLPLQ